MRSQRQKANQLHCSALQGNRGPQTPNTPSRHIQLMAGPQHQQDLNPTLRLYKRPVPTSPTLSPYLLGCFSPLQGLFPTPRRKWKVKKTSQIAYLPL